MERSDFRDANLTNAKLGRLIATWGSYSPRAVLLSANFSGGNLRHADLSKGVFQFANFRAANLTGADLRDCDFTKADFFGADLTGANVTGADFDGANLSDVKGLDGTIGMASAKNLASAIR